ncbi:MAG: sugar transferase [Verrucomicrobiota bacterium]
MNTPSQAKYQPARPGSFALGVPLWKRFLDIICILIFSPLLLPLGFLLAAIIKLASPGPAIFKQERIGYLGHRFVIFKFRTMVVAAETGIHKNHLDDLMAKDAPLVKLDASGDPRLIPGGRILRAMGLDELPQVLNVLRGEMSLVGPRPCVEYEYRRFTTWQRRRFETLPGLTGLWQVRGKNRTTFSQMIDFDIQYSENKTFWMDLKILFQTVPAILTQVRESRRRKASACIATSRTAPLESSLPQTPQ